MRLRLEVDESEESKERRGRGKEVKRRSLIVRRKRRRYFHYYLDIEFCMRATVPLFYGTTIDQHK